VRHFGVLDNVSSFPFESYLGRLKKLVRRPQQPCAQIVRRVCEGSCPPTLSNDVQMIKFKRPHFTGPLPVSCRNCHQYKQCIYKGFFFSVVDGDNCFFSDGKVCIIRNILQTVDSDDASSPGFLVVDHFTHKESFFIDPLDSQCLSMFVVDKLADLHKVIPLSTEAIKCILLPFKNKFVAMPQMHFS
jgi:hypothetical protein